MLIQQFQSAVRQLNLQASTRQRLILRIPQIGVQKKSARRAHTHQLSVEELMQILAQQKALLHAVLALARIAVQMCRI